MNLYLALRGFSEDDEDLLNMTNPENVPVPSSYTGPRLKFPLTSNQLEALIDAFKRKQVPVL